MQHAKPMTSDDHERVAAAIRAAETRTSGEIFCVVARSSGSYFYPAAFSVAASILVVSVLIALALDGLWISINLPGFAISQVIALAVALGLIGAFPRLRLLLISRRVLYQEAHANAQKQFLARNVHITAARTGVLIFVSLAERYAVVIADSGINQKVSQETWNAIVANLVASARRDRLTDGFVTAVGAVGELLAAHFPVGSGDRNELDDHLVEI